MRFNLTLLENDSDIRKTILDTLKNAIDSAISSTILKLKDPMAKIIKSALMSEPEYSSLISGKLRSELGISDINNVDIAINNLSQSIELIKRDTKVTNLGLSGGLDINIINNQNFNGAISDQSAFVNDTERGYSLPWLEWLLLKGNAIIVRNFSVKYGQNPRSRSGDAIMIESTSNWRIPPEFAGTITDNWTTRALSRVDKDILNLIKSTFESNL